MGHCWSRQKQRDLGPHLGTFNQRYKRRIDGVPSILEMATNFIQDNPQCISSRNGSSFNCNYVYGQNGAPTPPNSIEDNITLGLHKKYVRSLYNYQSTDGTNTNFFKGDRLEIIEMNGGIWWFVKRLSTGERGLIPWNYVAFEDMIESEYWFFGKITRNQSEEFLMNTKYGRGTFLIRESECSRFAYVLSVKDWDETREFHVKHYGIRMLENNSVFISYSYIFPTLQLLVMAYSEKAFNLCHVLTVSCTRPNPPIWDLSSQKDDHWEIDKSELIFHRKLGQGNFADVWLAEWRSSINVAVKMAKVRTKASTGTFFRESSLMKAYRHPNLIKLWAVSAGTDSLYLVLEYMNKGSLLEYLRVGEGRSLLIPELIHIAKQVANGLVYLEANLLIHRDIAARNILIGNNLIAKIGDFGLARLADSINQNEVTDDEIDEFRFPVKWTAPEAVRFGLFSCSSDVWSFGILLMEIFTYGQTPYPGMNGEEVIHFVESGYRMARPKLYFVPESIYELMLACWHERPQMRPSFLFVHYFLENFSFTDELSFSEIREQTTM